MPFSQVTAKKVHGTAHTLILWLMRQISTCSTDEWRQVASTMNTDFHSLSRKRVQELSCKTKHKRTIHREYYGGGIQKQWLGYLKNDEKTYEF